ncbi:uncharacterized protein LOC116842698 isoform X2 [Odontomachus brunneus]|uniref:uncharacterized protein LOC116842698 isoform X2 n=1 Tax=Odontomachus brunneus TaxID=486640 RepID=UPI0013F206BA|nr:uncharacterized protein LOC116842698 isoform X2 [Odontomachus brunneus]
MTVGMYHLTDLAKLWRSHYEGFPMDAIPKDSVRVKQGRLEELNSGIWPALTSMQFGYSLL